MSLDKDDLTPLRALANPLRVRIVSLLTGQPLSAVEVAEELGIAHASASYHLRQLAQAGFLRRVDDSPSRGGRGQPRRRYVYDHTSSLRLDRSGGQRLMREVLLNDLRRRLDEDVTQRLSADAEVWLDSDVWEEVVRLVDQAADLVHDKAGPARRPGAVKVGFTSILLELP